MIMWYNQGIVRLIMIFAAAMIAGRPALASKPTDTSRGDQMIAAYFRSETQKLANAWRADVKSWQEWTKHRDTYRRQLREMLGLDPLPERTPLHAVVTGTLERDDFKVEKLYFQSRPHLYVTANLYLPKKQTGRVPAILYLCGHSPAIKNGVSFGNKTKFQHHGAWFARNGYVCLVIDTLQFGEIQGIHRGTYDQNMWWWNCRGYTPAGVETWNAIRAIDYLVSRPEVDPDRIGVTGRSGGGAYSWYATALDDRIKVAVPVAGITNLHNHVVDGCVEGHCDCMYMVNTYRWDYPQVAALAAPRPLLISNTDRDKLFPFDGVVDVYRKVRHLYELDDKGPKVALQMAAGPHEDLQVLQLYALQWFNQHLKGENPLIESAAKDFFKPAELKVFDKLPADEINTRIQETFVPKATPPKPPESKVQWEAQRDKWMTELREKCFRGWPSRSDEPQPPQVHRVFEVTSGNVQFAAYDFESQPNVTLRLYLLLPHKAAGNKLQAIALRPVDADDWQDFLSALQIKFPQQLTARPLPKPDEGNYAILAKILASNRGLAFVAPRGIGPTRWTADPKERTHIRRRFMLLGQTLDSMLVWDVRRAIEVLRTIQGLSDVPLTLMGDRDMAGITLYAALFEPNIHSVELSGLSKSHRTGPYFLNVLRFLDVPQTVAMVAEKSHVGIAQDNADGWQYPLAVAKNLGWGQRIVIRPNWTEYRTTKSTDSK
ncbi:MAG TPA: acetylxylan esterase [Lacipirellulaceae bacterium]|nr:acetylxylan esterase [Lacipirellulaceae bacterium]